MILSNKRIMKALIKQRVCPGWSAPLLFTNPEDRFSRAEAHIITLLLLNYPNIWATSSVGLRQSVKTNLKCKTRVFICEKLF